VDAAVALVFWDELRLLVERDEVAARALHEMALGNYQQADAEARLAEAGFLDEDRHVLPGLKGVVVSAIAVHSDGTLAVGLPFDPDDNEAVRAWAASRVRQQEGFAAFVRDAREQDAGNRGSGRR
jgi:hypothetical protein